MNSFSESTNKPLDWLTPVQTLTCSESRQLGEGQTFTTGQAESLFGQMYACISDKGIHSLEFETDCLHYSQWKQRILKQYPKATLHENNTPILMLIEQIFTTKHGITCTHGSINLQVHGTAFQLQVWRALLDLPPACLASYQQIAQSIGRPTASRAVGNAIAKNPIAFLIPCHRVIQANGKLGQYRWNSSRKKALLTWEQGLNNHANFPSIL